MEAEEIKNNYQKILTILGVITIIFGITFILIAINRLEGNMTYSHLSLAEEVTINGENLSFIYHATNPKFKNVVNKNRRVNVTYEDNEMTPLDTIYYNLNGKEVKRISQDGPDIIKLLLTYCKKTNRVNHAIASNHVINEITKDQVNKIDAIFEFTKTKEVVPEKGFLISKSNKASRIVTGPSCDSIRRVDWNPAIKELGGKGAIASEVHVHTIKCKCENSIGSINPSFADMDKLKRNSLPSMILAYVLREKTPKSNIIEYYTPAKDTISTIGFYNKKGTIKTIEWSDLKKVMVKINKEKNK